MRRRTNRRSRAREEAPLRKTQRLAAERDALWDKPGICRACQGKARHGAIVGGCVVPLCSRHIATWDNSPEQKRAATIREQPAPDADARELSAFMDWLGRFVAEQRTGSLT